MIYPAALALSAVYESIILCVVFDYRLWLLVLFASMSDMINIGFEKLVCIYRLVDYCLAN